jgi:hypothetical protein
MQGQFSRIVYSSWSGLYLEFFLTFLAINFQRLIFSLDPSNMEVKAIEIFVR